MQFQISAHAELISVRKLGGSTHKLHWISVCPVTSAGSSSCVMLLLHYMLSPLLSLTYRLFLCRQSGLSPTYWAWVLLTPLPGKHMDQVHITICNWLSSWEICYRLPLRYVRDSFPTSKFPLSFPFHVPLTPFLFLSLPAFLGAWGHDGTNWGLLSCQPRKRDGGDAHIHKCAHSC